MTDRMTSDNREQLAMFWQSAEKIKLIEDTKRLKDDFLNLSSTFSSLKTQVKNGDEILNGRINLVMSKLEAHEKRLKEGQLEQHKQGMLLIEQGSELGKVRSGLARTIHETNELKSNITKLEDRLAVIESFVFKDNPSPTVTSVKLVNDTRDNLDFMITEALDRTRINY